MVKGSELLFKPPFTELDSIVQLLIITIVESGQRLPRVEHVLFPDLEDYELFIPHMDLDESVVSKARQQALVLLRANTAGPRKYVEATYTQYRSLMDGNASLEVDNFLKSSENELQDFGKVCLYRCTVVHVIFTVYTMSMLTVHNLPCSQKIWRGIKFGGLAVLGETVKLKSAKIYTACMYVW